MSGRRVYLDIETAFDGRITIVGIFRPGRGTIQLVAPEVTAVNLLDLLGDTELIKTYNGDRFDLPVIKQQLGVDLKLLFTHQDIMYQCWKHSLKGGLKAVERQLGLVRETEGVDGIMAMQLWSHWQESKNEQSLQRLLRYNQEDVELLAQVEQLLLEREAGVGE